MRGFDNIHVHVHRGGERETDDAVKHDPHTGQFTAGPGANPQKPHEHVAQAAYHLAQHADLTKRGWGGGESAQMHKNMAHQHKVEAGVAKPKIPKNPRFKTSYGWAGGRSYGGK